MNKLIFHAALALACLAPGAGALAAAKVTFVNPEKMTDVPRHESDRESMKAILLDHFNVLAARLPADQELKIEIIDVDPAGDVFPRVSIRDVRVLKGLGDRPAMHLRYSIEQNGKVLRSGESHLSDAAYLMGSNRYGNDLYGHEKQMLDDWFRKDVIAKR